MKFLFIHQNFPGQYLHLAQYLQGLGGHEIVGLGETKNIKNRGVIQDITTIGYPTPEGAGETTHHYLQSTEAALRRGQTVARSLLELKNKGFVPDVISVHPGWGEALFVRDVYPHTPILMFCEYYFRAGEADLAFDPEFPCTPDWTFSIRIRNSAQLLSLITASACVSPTHWQASRYPAFVREGARIIHDGVNTDFMTPDPGESLSIQPLRAPGESRVRGYPTPITGNASPDEGPGSEPDGPPLTLSRKDKVITYIGRNLEPYRGFHIFLRSLPAIQRLHPDAHTLIVGHDGISYSPVLPEGQTYKEKYLEEMRGELDLSRIHFLGRIPYPALRALFRIASAHVYLTYPFVLSWSALEAMACESLVIASRTQPVEEVITHGQNGILVDFFDKDALIAAVDAALSDPDRFAPLRKSARNLVVERYRLEKCLKRQAELLYELAGGNYPNPS